MTFLNGYKTYIIAAILALLVAAEKVLGWDVPGFDAGGDWIGFLLAALGISTARNGAKTDVKNAL
jgi:hypothetical protein